VPVATRLINQEPLISGSESYGHIRIAEFIANNGIPQFDPAMPERIYQVNAFDLLLSAFIKVLGTEIASFLLPFLLGLGSLWLLLAITKRWKLSSTKALGVHAVFILSPFFVSAFTQTVSSGLELFLMMFLLFVLAPNERPIISSFAAILVATILATFGILPAIIAILLPLLARTVNHRMPKFALGASLAAFITLITIALPAYLRSEAANFARPMPVVQAISDFSGAGGLSLFAWILAFIGLLLLWHIKKKYYAVMITITIALAVSLFIPSSLVAAHLVVSFLAGYALAFFATMRWSFEEIRFLTILVVLCGLLFSTLTYAQIISKDPSQELKEASLAIKDILPENATLLLPPDYGFSMAYWSGKQVFIDGWLTKTPQVNERWEVTQAIWHSREITDVRPLLYKNNIGAIVITKDMRQGQVWDLPEQDLLFLLRNSETFKNAHKSSLVEVWAVMPENS